MSFPWEMEGATRKSLNDTLGNAESKPQEVDFCTPDTGLDTEERPM